MASVESTLKIKAPLADVYAQWTRFEDFPSFMEGIEQVEQVSDTVLRFTGTIGGVRRSWNAKIVEQVPDERVQWRSIEGPENGGTVLFQALRPGETKVQLYLDFAPESFTEKAGTILGIFDAKVRRDLENFKEKVENEGINGPGWPGEIHGARRTH